MCFSTHSGVSSYYRPQISLNGFIGGSGQHIKALPQSIEMIEATQTYKRFRMTMSAPVYTSHELDDQKGECNWLADIIRIGYSPMFRVDTTEVLLYKTCNLTSARTAEFVVYAGSMNYAKMVPGG